MGLGFNFEFAITLKVVKTAYNDIIPRMQLDQAATDEFAFVPDLDGEGVEEGVV